MKNLNNFSEFLLSIAQNKKLRITKILFTLLLFANPGSASAFQTSFVGFNDVLSSSIQNSKLIVDADEVENGNRFRNSINQVSLLRRGQCSIRRASSQEDNLYSAIVPINAPATTATGQIVQAESSLPSDPTIVMTALHTFAANQKGAQPPVNPISGGINPNLFKIKVKGCAKDQKVVAACKPPPETSGASNDYIFLVLEKSECQKQVQPFQIQAVEKQDVRSCPKIHVACSLTPGFECGTKKDRDNLDDYAAATSDLLSRKLFFGDGQIESVKDYNQVFQYFADTADGCSGGIVTCDYGNGASLIGIHTGESEHPGDTKATSNAGAIIHSGMIQTLKDCTRLMRQHIK